VVWGKEKYDKSEDEKIIYKDENDLPKKNDYSFPNQKCT